MPHGSGTEKVVLGSSRGAIEVEAVNLDKIRGNLSNIEKLREVSLDDERIAVPGEPGEIRKMCPGMLCLSILSNYHCSSGALHDVTVCTLGLR